MITARVMETFSEKMIQYIAMCMDERETPMRIRHGVFFNISHMFTRYANGKWVISKEGTPIKNWLDENALGEYSIRTSHILFEDYDDALLCYLRYKG